ncbi:MAG: Lipoprotein-releasing system ATP-binding protein LolD [Oscillospiraceae bacterium]|jgi:putative ABC transport system ATP-binding protein
MKPLITVNHLTKVYHMGESQVYALSDVTLRINCGEFLAIVGRSGSGKSTLMNIIGCLDTPTSGEYYLEGVDVFKLSESKLTQIRNRKIGFIFQNFNLLGGQDALENVELPLFYRKIPRSERRALAQEALEQVGLGSRMHHRPAQMSGGQQQRVAIARAIAAKPPIILADEPTGNLDSRSGSEVMEILHSLHRSGRTVVLITHDDRIADTADRVIQIQDGKIIGEKKRN